MGGFSVAEDALQAIAEGRQRSQQLLLFQGVLGDEVGSAFLELLSRLKGGQASEQGALGHAYGRLFSLLADEGEFYSEPLVGDAWQNHLLDRILGDENAFSRKSQRTAVSEMGTALLEAVRQDLRHLQVLFYLNGTILAEHAGRMLDSAANRLVTWDTLSPLSPAVNSEESPHLRLKRTMARATDWGLLVDKLADYYLASGTGLFGRFKAFRWICTDGKGRLEGVASLDPTFLRDLVGYESERRTIVRNTEQFLRGYPANNVLLYGDRGTGKSSTVKALLNDYASQGLRLIEVPKQRLNDFPQILGLIRDRRERFILFVDDLSFDEHETGYKDLKAVLEGSLEARPANVLVYATSNRRHLVQERLGDRPAYIADEEPHARDTVEEKLSFSDRFGITAIFSTPDQERFLTIVSAIAQQRRLPISEEELRPRAIRWAAWQNGRSCRSARQFVDYLTGELGVHWPPA